MTNSTICIANQKGGVGKTTTTINLSTALAAVGKKTLLIDLDPQGNASTGLGIEHCDREQSNIYYILNGKNAKECVLKTQIPNLFIIPSIIDLAASEVELYENETKEMVLKKALKDISTEYDYIIIDCPPSLGLLTINALTAAHSVIIPLQCEFFALEGLAHLLNTINLVKKLLNPGLQIEGIVLTMVDRRNNLSHYVSKDVRETFKELVYTTVIPRNVKLTEASSHGKPALIYDTNCSGSVAYMMLAKELLSDKTNKNDNEALNGQREKSAG